jgi:ferrous iron transport protein A
MIPSKQTVTTWQNGTVSQGEHHDAPQPCPLSQVAPGQRVRLAALTTEHHVARRLAELGLTPGIELEIIQDAGGPLLVAVRNTRLAVRRTVARNILVIPQEERS